MRQVIWSLLEEQKYEVLFLQQVFEKDRKKKNYVDSFTFFAALTGLFLSVYDVSAYNTQIGPLLFWPIIIIKTLSIMKFRFFRKNSESVALYELYNQINLYAIELESLWRDFHFGNKNQNETINQLNSLQRTYENTIHNIKARVKIGENDAFYEKALEGVEDYLNIYRNV